MVISDDYVYLKVWFFGAGGAFEIVVSCGEVIVIVKQFLCVFVEWVDFVISVGYGLGFGDCEWFGFMGKGLIKVIIDFGVFEPVEGCELVLM